ncbi:MAG: hypothetical protein ACE5IO_06580 [Thermoplasmata archaeon]
MYSSKGIGCSIDPERDRSIAHSPPVVYRTKWPDKFSCHVCWNIYDKNGKKVWNFEEDGPAPEWWG